MSKIKKIDIDGINWNVNENKDKIKNSHILPFWSQKRAVAGGDG